MILVNLLPQELRVKETKKVEIPYRVIGICIFAVFLALSIYNLFFYIRIREEYRNFENQWKTIAEKSAQAEELENEVGAGLVSEMDFYETFVDPSLETAEVLNLISDLMPPGAWLTQVKFDRVQKEIQLVLHGLSESSSKGSKLTEIQNFANGLKGQMEHALGSGAISPFHSPGFPPQIPGLRPPPGIPGGDQKLEAAVATASQESAGERKELIQFSASFKTRGFPQK